jgi:hypothetical protein
MTQKMPFFEITKKTLPKKHNLGYYISERRKESKQGTI